MVLPAPVGPTIATVWPGPGHERQPLDQRRAGLVAEGHVLEDDLAAGPRRRQRGAALRRLLDGVEQLEDPLGGRDARLQQVDHRGDLGERLAELPGVLDERLHLAQAHGAGRDAHAAQHGDGDVAEVPEERRHRHDQPGDELRPEARPEQLRVLVVEDRLDLPPAAEDLGQRVAGEGLLDVGVEPSRAAPLVDEQPLRALHDQAAHDDGERHRHQRDDGQQRRDPQHHPDDAEHRQHRGEQLAERLLQGLAEVVDVVGDPAEQLAARLLVGVRERQPVQLGGDLLAQAEDGALDGVVEQERLQPREQRRGQVDREREQQHAAERAGVDALARDEVEPRQQPGAVVVAGGARLLDELLLGRAGRHRPAEQPGEDEVGRAAQQRRPDHRQPDADDAQDDDGEHAAALGAQPADDPARGRAEVDRALSDHAAAERPAAGARTGDDALGLLHAAALHGGHATSCKVSCEATISW